MSVSRHIVLYITAALKRICVYNVMYFMCYASFNDARSLDYRALNGEMTSKYKIGNSVEVVMA